MKKYDKSKIMKRAWKIRRSWSARGLSFGECLKHAWYEAKIEYQNSCVPKKFTNGMKITVDGYTRSLSRWTKGGFDRVYINGGSRKGDGFVDIKNKRPYLRHRLTYAVDMAEKILAMEF